MKTNDQISRALLRIADLLEAQKASSFRVQAFRDAASTVRHHSTPVARIATDLEELIAMPGIGRRIATLVREYCLTGRARYLERLEGEVCPEECFRCLPGVGEHLATRLHEELHLETFEDVGEAAQDGRILAMRGVGPSTLEKIVRSLEMRRQLALSPEEGQRPTEEPGVDLLLEVDAEYRDLADREQLPRIAPRRRNPAREAWLPTHHVDDHGWHFTAHFSNTRRAHDLGHTRDWVVIHFDRDDGEGHLTAAGQATVVTATRGRLEGTRVVRGREEECQRLAELSAAAN